MFTSLEELHPTASPNYPFLLLTDTLKCDANFLFHHFIAHHLKQGNTEVMFIALDQSFQHYGTSSPLFELIINCNMHSIFDSKNSFMLILILVIYFIVSLLL